MAVYRDGSIIEGETPLVEQIARDTGCAWIGDDGWLRPEKLPRSERWPVAVCVAVVGTVSLALWVILAAVSAGLL